MTNEITVSAVMKIFGLIGTIIGAWLVLQSTFVIAGDYQEDRLSTLLRFLNSDIRTIENSIENSRSHDDSKRVIQLEHERNDLEQQRRDIRQRQLAE